jgi:restriction system protein
LARDPPGKDGGLDIIAHPDPLGTRSPRIKVQVKRTEQKVTVDGVCAFLSLIEDDDAGLFVATGGEAQALTRTSRRKMRLIDLEGVFGNAVNFKRT